MKIHLTIDDIAKLVEVKLFEKFTAEVESKIMPLMEQLENLKTAVAGIKPAVDKEFTEVKAKFEALKAAQDVLTAQVEDLTAKVAALDGVDLSTEIAAIADSLAQIDTISESDAPAPAPVV